MREFTDYELKVMRECCRNYTSSSGGLTKAAAQHRAVLKIEVEMRERGIIRPLAALQHSISGGR